MRKTAVSCNLERCYLCRLCVPDWLPAVASHRENRKYKKGATIFKEGDKVEGIFFVYTGKVKVHQHWGGKKELIVRFAKAGDIFGYRGLGNDKIYPITATALEDVVVCYVDIAFFEASLRVNHDLSYQLMNLYATELQEAERRMRNLAHMEVKGRVADTLLKLKKTFGTDAKNCIDIQLTKQDLASYCGTTYETFSRMMNELVAEKLIRVQGKNIVILKGNKLEALTATGEENN